MKKTSIGLFENEQSLFFYQIDYFGDIFGLEYRHEGFAENQTKWTQLSIEGDKFEVSFLRMQRVIRHRGTIHPLILNFKFKKADFFENNV